MSSAFLYLAIVAIWAFVLVPRWLRRSHAAPDVVTEERDGPAAQDRSDYDYGPQGETDEYGEAAEYGEDGAEPAWSEPAGPAKGARNPPRPSEPPRLAPAPSRSRVLQARRRLLTMLVLLTSAAAACTVLKFVSWWACIPPAGMLGMYLLLLREAAFADAEQARRRTVMELRVQATGQHAYEPVPEPEERQPAEVIDISARVGDQLYDQYADATVRAVGD